MSQIISLIDRYLSNRMPFAEFEAQLYHDAELEKWLSDIPAPRKSEAGESLYLHLISLDYRQPASVVQLRQLLSDELAKRSVVTELQKAIRNNPCGQLVDSNKVLDYKIQQGGFCLEENRLCFSVEYLPVKKSGFPYDYQLSVQGIEYVACDELNIVELSNNSGVDITVYSAGYFASDIAGQVRFRVADNLMMLTFSVISDLPDFEERVTFMGECTLPMVIKSDLYLPS
ncbi:MAG: hypothetical protein KBE15_09945 [Budvicia sp.]|nr:hypothetical protein [Budvicia sp.]